MISKQLNSMESNVLKSTLARYKAELLKAPSEVAIIAHNFFLKGFAKGGKQINGHFEKWEDRAFEMDRSIGKRQTLTKTGALSDSIKQRHSNGIVTIYTNSPYANIHQTGGEIKITPKMRKFFWAMYYKEMGNVKMTKKGAARKTKSNERITEIAQIWKNLALTQKNSFHIPKREIFYDTTDLAKVIDRYFKQRLKNI